MDGTKQIDEGVRYGPYKNMPPFSFEIIRLLFEYLDPLLILTEATKTVRVSHWGYILVDEYFAVENIGSKLKGEYSRVDFEYLRKGDNCLKSISAVYPWYIQSMYFHDYIGNISSTNALREDDRVALKYQPRFPICGGWKTDWNQGYQMPTKYHLTRSLEDENLYTLEFDFLHNYDVLLAENYTVEITLPYGASDFQVSSSRYPANPPSRSTPLLTTSHSTWRPVS